MSINFNEISAGSNATEEKPRKNKDLIEESIRTGERTRFVQKPNPMVDRAYQIFEYNSENSSYDHVGDYVLINKDEPRELTEKKVINLVTLINKKTDLIDISNLTKTRLLFTVVPEIQSGNQTKVILKDYDGSGVSKDNAVFTIRKGIFYDDRKF